MAFKEKLLNNAPLLLDGSMGAVIMAQGYSPNNILSMNITDPEIIQHIHRGYYSAGCDVAITNTFNLNSFSLSHLDYSLEEIIEAAVSNANEARRNFENKYVAFDLAPSGENTLEDAYFMYKKILKQLKNEKIDLIIIETLSTTQDVEAARRAVREETNLPFWASLTFKENKRTWFGTSLKQWAEYINSSDLDCAGINCTLTPKEMLPLACELKDSINIPVFAQPNRGQPVKTQNGFGYELSADNYAKDCAEFYKNGIHILGGCCGADEECMKRLKNSLSQI